MNRNYWWIRIVDKSELLINQNCWQIRIVDESKLFIKFWLLNKALNKTVYKALRTNELETTRNVTRILFERTNMIYMISKNIWHGESSLCNEGEWAAMNHDASIIIWVQLRPALTWGWCGFETRLFSRDEASLQGSRVYPSVRSSILSFKGMIVSKVLP